MQIRGSRLRGPESSGVCGAGCRERHVVVGLHGVLPAQQSGRKGCWAAHHVFLPTGSGRLAVERAACEGVRMDMATALRELGVTDDVLTDDEKMRLEREGFLPLGGILAAGEGGCFHWRVGE